MAGSVNHVGGPPAEQKLYSRLRSVEDGRRIWQASEELSTVSFPGASRSGHRWAGPRSHEAGPAIDDARPSPGV